MRDESSATAPSGIAVPAADPAVATGPARTSDAPATATATAPATAPAPSPGARGGLVFAALGVVAFSLTFPGTVWALEGFGPWSVTTVRMVLAGLIAGSALAALRVPAPPRHTWPGLAVVAAGTVVGFPLLTTLALETSSTSHAAVVVGLLPLATAAYSALRTGHRPSRTFWAAALAGAAVVLAFALHDSGGGASLGDLYLAGALLICAAAYGEGGRLAREMPGWQVIGWALVGCLPAAAVGAAFALAAEPVTLNGHAVAGIVWVAAGSQFLGLLLWYRGLARTGVARASQIQLAQPLLTLVWSVLLLGEHLTPAAPAAAVGVLVCIAVTQRSRS